MSRVVGMQYVGYRDHNFSDNYTPDMDSTSNLKFAKFGMSSRR